MIVEVQRSGEPVVVDDVPDSVLLQLAAQAEVSAREADRSKLRIATAWAHRFEVDDLHEAAHWSDADARDVCEAIGGEGTPLVHEAAVTPLAAALGTTARSAMQWMSDALDLDVRLPRIHAGVESLEIAPWRARRIARLTHALTVEAAAYVDRLLAPVADTCGVARIEREVAEATARFDPVEQQAAESEAEAAWDVRLDHLTGPVWGGTSRLEIIGDTPTLQRAYEAWCADAHAQLDPDLPADEQPPLGHRKVAAVGRLLDAVGATVKTKLYVHLDRSDVATVEKLGPLSVARLHDWLSQTRFTLQPVIDVARTDAVDRHDPPAWMRELVVLRDRTCAHPGCDRDSRECDLDHVEAYVEMDDGGPPGQTRPDNLAPLCRRHHRAKTHHGWTYRREPDGSYTWTSPFGHVYVKAAANVRWSSSTRAASGPSLPSFG